MSLQEKIWLMLHKIYQSKRVTVFVRLKLIAGEPRLLAAGLSEGSRDHLEWRHSLCDMVQPGGGIAQGQRELYRGDSSDGEKWKLLWGSCQLCDQDSAHPVQPHCAAKCNIARKWYCTYPAIWECAPPRDLPLEPVHIDKDDMLDPSLFQLFIPSLFRKSIQKAIPEDK
jgi:hypothetical protein